MASDRDGVRITYTRAARAIGLALAGALACLGVAAWVVLHAGRKPRVVETAEPPPGPAVRRDEPSPPPEAKTPPPTVEPPPAAATPKPDEPPPAEDEQTYTLLKPGEKAGLAVFPPPGTKPVKRGIVVPEDYELPEGYVRHYQTTDDGRRLPPILMFHPDYGGVDRDGKPLALPEDRIVPPEMAPPGLPVRMLDPDKEGAEPPPAPSGRAR
jgi:hypothetical protein